MIRSIQLLRNIGQFDSVSNGANISLGRLTLTYAENGRGKTTLTAILRSLATGDPISIVERRRLAAVHPPRVILDCTGGPPAAIFQNNAWNRTFPGMFIFDDHFVDQNIYSGLVIESDHRQNLHDLILGARGVALTQQLQNQIKKIEEHNSALRVKTNAIPSAERAGLTIDDFCNLPARSDIDEAIQTAERSLAAVQEQNAIRSTSLFTALDLPAFDIDGIEQLLKKDLPSIDAQALAQIQEHLNKIGDKSENWVADGIKRITKRASEEICPFCAQSLSESPVINHYRAYFSDAYNQLKRSIDIMLSHVENNFGGDVQAQFEREVRVAGERRQFWSRFCDVPAVNLETAVIAKNLKAAKDAVISDLKKKQSAPLDRHTLSDDARTAIAAYEVNRQSIRALSQQLINSNGSINIVKQGATVGNLSALTGDVARLKAIKSRYSHALSGLCNEYLAEKTAKTATENTRDQIKATLEQYRTSTFPGYQTAINNYLGLFNAGFRLDSVQATDTRGGPTCTYNIVINNTPVPITGEAPPGEPSFRNTLSAGDRNTLALAFFFALLDQDPDLQNKIIVIDDPMSSLDEHRSLTTIQELRRLSQRTIQVIVLSHNKGFLCQIWEGTSDKTQCSAFEVARDNVGSTIRIWNVKNDLITEHDRRHALLTTYLANGGTNKFDVAAAIRPVLESYFRVAYPEHFPPGFLLGQFKGLCDQRKGTAQEILKEADIQELDHLIEYANKFHHDTNPAYQTEVINDGQLSGFVGRALKFIKKA